ncbi:hypothetical protein D3C73_1075110 [compost metagenome]
MRMASTIRNAVVVDTCPEGYEPVSVSTLAPSGLSLPTTALASCVSASTAMPLEAANTAAIGRCHMRSEIASTTWKTSIPAYPAQLRTTFTPSQKGECRLTA